MKLTEKFTTNVAAPSHQEIPQAEASAQPTEEHASTADDNQAAEETASVRADDCIPAAEEIARATTSVAPEEIVRPAEASTAVREETDHARATASVVPEKMNQFPLLLLHLHQVQFFLLHQKQRRPRLRSMQL